MGRSAVTLRIDSAKKTALEHLSKVEGRPVNQLLNEAITGYLSQQGQREASLAANLAALRAYRLQDPGFQHAIAAFVEAEVTLDDPLEGVVEAPRAEGLLKPTGPVQRRIRELLRA